MTRTKKLLSILALTALPFILGFVVSSLHSGTTTSTTGKISENHGSISSTDRLTISSSGDILNLDSNGTAKVVAGQGLIDPVWSGDSLIAVAKTTNYSQIDLFTSAGALKKKLFDGSSKVVDYSKWATDPATTSDGTMLAYVSDKGSSLTGVPDNALFLEDLATSRTQLIASPNGYSGGIATPRFDPANPKLIAYSFYQYDSANNPVSTIHLTDTSTKKTIELTTASQNAFQEDFSPDGTKIIFLSRHNDQSPVTLTIADFDGAVVSNPQSLYSGELAYPRFSYDGKSVYFLEAVKNKGFDLYKAEISSGSLKNITHITSGSALNGDSSFEVTKR